MVFACPICSEKLEKQPGEAQGKGQKEVNISATPCGHIFHAYCIQKWLTGNLASSKQCPCCRKDVPRLRCLALYPNIRDEGLDDTLSQDDDTSARCCNHIEVISGLKDQVNRLEKEAQDKDQIQRVISEEFDEMLEKYRNEKMISDTWMIKAKEFESFRDLANEREARLKTVEAKLKGYTLIEQTLKGIEAPISEELPLYPPNSNSVKNLLEQKHILSSELRTASKKYEEIKAKYDNLRSEKIKLQIAFEKKTKEYKEMQHVYEISRVNGRIRERSESPVAGPSLAISDTPKVFRLSKRRLQEPLASVPGPSPGVDSDVNVIPVMYGKKFKAKKQLAEPKVKASSTDSQSSQILSFDSGISRNTQSQPTKATSSVKSVSGKVRNTGLKNNDTIVLSSDDSQEMDVMEVPSDDEEANFRVRGCVPGAPLPSSQQIKNLQQKVKNPTLGTSSKNSKPPGKFNFKKKYY